MSPIIVDKENKKKVILQAATRVFARQGIPNTNMIDIAREAGIGKGTIYEYFRSKEEIINETFRAFMARFTVVDQEALNSNGNALEKLFLIIDGWMELLAGSPDEVRVIVEFWADGARMHDTERMNELTHLYIGYVDFLQTILLQGIDEGVIRPLDPKIMSALIAGSLDGITLHWIINPDLFDLKEAILLYKENLARALQAG